MVTKRRSRARWPQWYSPFSQPSTSKAIRAEVDGPNVSDSVYKSRPETALNNFSTSRKRYEKIERELADLLDPKKKQPRSSRMRLVLLGEKRRWPRRAGRALASVGAIDGAGVLRTLISTLVPNASY